MTSIHICKKISKILIIVGIVFLALCIFTKIPDREIPWDYEEYVGGDAYNIMIEASIRGGEIAGTKVVKTLYFIFAVALFLVAHTLRVINKYNTPQITNHKNDTDIEAATEESTNKPDILHEID